MKTKKLILLVALALLASCAKKENPRTVYVPPEVKDNGDIIYFPPGAQARARIETQAFGKGEKFIQIEAPARIVATVGRSVSSGGRIVLFESADLNTAYATYRQARNAINRATKNLRRVKDMYSMEVATERDIIEAETEQGNASANVAEAEGKLRAAGINPTDLNKYGSNVAWLIADISESRFDTTKSGTPVHITFESYPDKKFKGRVQAVGDNIDPETRTVKVRILLPNTHNTLKPGMFAKVEFLGDMLAPMVVPFTSVFTVEGVNFVFVEEAKDTFRKTNVVLGNSNVNYVEILSGLKKGATVATEGGIFLKGLSVGF